MKTTRVHSPGSLQGEAMAEEKSALSKDMLFNGRLICWQPNQGYRFSIDSVLLAHFATVKLHETVLDIGTGCGILPLLLHYRNSALALSMVGLENQKELYEIAKQNVKANNIDQRCRVIHGDIAEMKTLFEAESFDRVIFNPPFYPPQSGRLSVSAQQRAARHQTPGNLELFVKGAAYCVKNKGRVYCVYPISGLITLLSLLATYKLAVQQLRLVYPYPHQQKSANLALLASVKNGGENLQIVPPLYIYQEQNGAYSEAVKRFYNP